jgi:hypothetical protein
MKLANAIKALRGLGTVEERVREDIGWPLLSVKPAWGFSAVIGFRPPDSDAVTEWRAGANASWMRSFRLAVREAFRGHAYCKVMGRDLSLFASAHHDGDGRLFHRADVSFATLDEYGQARCNRQFLCFHKPVHRGESCKPDHITMVVGAIARREASQLVDFLQEKDERFRAAWEAGFAT